MKVGKLLKSFRKVDLVDALQTLQGASPRLMHNVLMAISLVKVTQIYPKIIYTGTSQNPQCKGEWFCLKSVK